MTAIHDVIIIGSGPAGYMAALYAARAQLKPLVFQGSVTAGGALVLARYSDDPDLMLTDHEREAIMVVRAVLARVADKERDAR